MTLDWSFDLKAMARLVPEVIARPRWLSDFARAGGPPDLTAPNIAPPGGPAPSFFGVYGEWMMTPPASWEDVAWLREQWDGPMMVKGITRPDDARRAVDAGADAISVSNHGGNNLDGTPATIRALPGVVDAVGDHVEILLDGGIRRGSDVVKAPAVGARSVMIGRAALWGLAANGETGVANILDILRAGIDETLSALGRSSIHDVKTPVRLPVRRTSDRLTAGVKSSCSTTSPRPAPSPSCSASRALDRGTCPA